MTLIQLRVRTEEGYKSLLPPMPESKALQVAAQLLRRGVLCQRKMVLVKR